MHWPLENSQAMFQEIVETCHDFLIRSRLQFMPSVNGMSIKEVMDRAGWPNQNIFITGTASNGLWLILQTCIGHRPGGSEIGLVKQ